MASGNKIKPEIWHQWLQHSSTQRLLALEAGWLRDWIKQLRGHHLLYAGVDDRPKFIRRGRLAHAFCVSLPWQMPGSSHMALMHESHWPLADESLDVVVLQHGLDMTRHPHQMVREAARCVVSNGYLIIVGFNPVSPWGAMRWVRTFSTQLPWLSNPVTSKRLRDWLTLLDFRVEQVQPVAHVWPWKIGSESFSRRVNRVLAGQQGLPASAYILVARKTVAGMTPIRPMRWGFGPQFGVPASAGY